MHWQLQPIIWPIIIATLALLAAPHRAHPQPPVAQSATGTPAQEPSPAIRAACDADVRTLCPSEYETKDARAIASCMKSHAPFIGSPPYISPGCVKAWLDEHPPERKSKKKK
jgi:hypothetical protein